MTPPPSIRHWPRARNTIPLFVVLVLMVPVTACSDGSTPDDDDRDAAIVHRPDTHASRDVVGPAPDATDVTDTAPDEGRQTGEWTLFGEVRLAPDTTPVGDGVGTLYVAALTDCGAWSSAVEIRRTSDVDMRVDSVSYGFELPSGTWHLAAFLDDGLDADTRTPSPGSGDLALQNPGDGTSCTHYELGGGSGTIEYDLQLNARVP